MKVQTLNHSLPNTSLKGAASATRAAEVKTESPSVNSEPMDVGTPEPEKDWTVLFYMNGNNALSSQMVSTMRQMEFVGSQDNMHMAAQLARPKAALDRWSKDWNGVRRYEIQNNGQDFSIGAVIIDGLTSFLPGKSKGIKSEVLQELDGTDMGKSESLEQFLEWGIRKFPAKNYMVVMMGPSEGVSGMQHDVTTGSHMTVADLGSAFKNVHEKTGKKIDILSLQGSATNSLEVAYELKDHAKYMVGSQALVDGQSMPLAMVMNEIANINKTGGRDALTLAQYMLLMNSMAPGALSIVDLDKVGPAKEAWDQLSTSLLQAEVGKDKLHQLLEKTQDFQGASKNEAYGNNRDAIHFAKLVRDDSDIKDEKVKAAATKAIEALEASLVGDVANGKRMGEANGLSVFAPTNMGFFRPDGTPVIKDSLRDAKYSETNFAKDTQWDELLATASKDSMFNNTLKKLGFSENSVDKLHGNYNQHIGKLNMALGFAGMAGYMNGINAWRGADASGFMLLGPQTSLYAGVAGAGNEAVRGLGRVYNGAVELKDRDEVANGAFDVASATAKGVANLGYMVPALKPYAQTAGMLMFMSPWLRNIYGVYDQYQQIKEGVELGVGDAGMPKVQQWGAAALRHYGKQNVQDTHQPSWWQKMVG